MIWFFGQQVPKYIAIWKHESDPETASGVIPECNGMPSIKEEDGRYTYAFAGRPPGIEPVKADAANVAVFGKSAGTDPNNANRSEEISAPTFTVIRTNGTVTETTIVSCEIPAHAGRRTDSRL